MTAAARNRIDLTASMALLSPIKRGSPIKACPKRGHSKSNSNSKKKGHLLGSRKQWQLLVQVAAVQQQHQQLPRKQVGPR